MCASLVFIPQLVMPTHLMWLNSVCYIFGKQFQSNAHKITTNIFFSALFSLICEHDFFMPVICRFVRNLIDFVVCYYRYFACMCRFCCWVFLYRNIFACISWGCKPLCVCVCIMDCMLRVFVLRSCLLRFGSS